MKTKNKYFRNVSERNSQNRNFRTQFRTLRLLSELHTALLKLKLVTKKLSTLLLSTISRLVFGIEIDPIFVQSLQVFKTLKL